MSMSTQRLQLVGRTFAWLMALLMLGLVYLLFHDVYSRILRPPPFQFTQDFYPPDHLNVCPGDTLRWKSALIVRSAPTVLYSNTTIWSMAEAKTVVPGHEPTIYIWTEAQLGANIARAASYRLPVLPPGQYQVRVAASGLNTDSDAYAVPFTIRADCPEPRQP